MSQDQTSAFAPFVSYEHRENVPLCGSANSRGNPLLQLTVRARSAFNPSPETTTSHGAPVLSLPDGRLNAGIHLPLLNGRYKYLETLGEGVSAQALLVEDTMRPGRLVTIKVMRRQYKTVGQKEVRTLRFLHSQSASKAPGIVELYETFMIGGHYCFVTERLYPRFLDWLAESAQLPLHVVNHSLKKILYQLLTAIDYMHSLGIVHADIKPDNLLFVQPHGSHSVAVKLIDLGGAVSVTETNTEELVYELQTLPYRSPEAALGLPAGKPMDLWSIGVIAAEALLMRPLFPCHTPMELLKEMVSILGPIPEILVQNSVLSRTIDLSFLCTSRVNTTNPSLQSWVAHISGAAVDVAPQPALYLELERIDPQLTHLVRGLLAYNPAERLTAQEALQHPCFSSLGGPRVTMTSSLQQQQQKPSALVQQQEQQPPSIIQKNVPVIHKQHPQNNKPVATKVQSTSVAAIHTATPAQHTPDESDDEAAEPAAAASVAVSDSKPKQGTKTKRADSQPGTSSDNNKSKRGRGDKKPWWVV